MMQLTETVKQILIINIIFYIGSTMVGEVSYGYLSLYFIQNPNFEIWQFVTHMFMHAQFPEIRHILFNMLGVVFFGSVLENVWGAKKFLFFYISCGLGAALLHTLINYYHFSSGLNILIEHGFVKEQVLELIKTGQFDERWKDVLTGSEFNNFLSSYFVPAVGASGALYGILVAYAVLFPNSSLMLLFLPIPIKAKYFVGFLVASDLFMGIRGTSILGGGGIAHFAHVGGALTGFLMAWYWKKNDFNKHRWN